MIINFLKQSENLKRLLISQNTNLTEENIFTFSSKEIEELLNETTVGDSFVSSINQDQIIFENGIFTDSENTENENVKLTDILNDFIQISKVKNTIDTDSNGILSNEEITEFLKLLGSLDENPEDISINDIFSAFNSVEEGTFGKEETNETSEIENEIIRNAVNTGRPIGNTRRASNNQGNIGSTTPTNTGRVVNVPESSSPENLSLEELQTKKTEKENELKTAQETVKSVYAGETDGIKAAQRDCNEKENAYEEALKNDQNITDELRTRQQDNQENINNQKSIINEVESNIHTKETEINSQNTIIASDKSTIAALESSIANLKSQSSNNQDVKDDIETKLTSANEKLRAAKQKLENDEAALEKLEKDKTELENKLTEENEKLSGLETERESIEAEILANCSQETKTAMEAFKAAEANVEEVKASELATAKATESKIQTELNEINELINTKNANKIESEYSVNSLDNPEQLYKTMGLEEKGLNYEVFLSAIEGYKNLDEEDRETGFLGIFDTTQSSDRERYYLLDLNNFELIGQTVLKIGSGNMDNVVTANQEGSHATLSGFEKVGSEYYSSSMEKQALRLIGLEEGINDNAESKGTVVHYTVYEHTWGCKGFPPVMSNGNIDLDATYDLMRELFPTGSIVYTHPTDERYWELSELYA